MLHISFKKCTFATEFIARVLHGKYNNTTQTIELWEKW